MADLPPSLPELEAAARERLPLGTYDYYAGGAEDEITLERNRTAYEELAFRPKRLVDVSRIDTGVELLGQRLPHPIGIAPTAFQRLAHEDGELATAAATGGGLMIASSLSSYTVEEIVDASAGPVWLQLYVFRDRSLSEELVRRAEAAGCTGLVLTVDVPVQGNRERDRRNRFALPDGIDMANFRGALQENLPDTDRGSALHHYIATEFDPTLTWQAIEWLRSVTALPVVVKGVLRGDDAERAVDHGAAAVIVSNHGGRQLDGARATIRALPEVVEGARGRVPVLIDGGIRRGRDVVRALCLGASMVLIGRPYLWGLNVAGREGVEHVLGILRDELERTLALVGCPRMSELGPDYVVRD